MYDNNNLTYIFTILEAIEKIKSYTKGIDDFEEFYEKNDQMNFNAVVSLLIAIGEENKKISEDIKRDFKFDWDDVSKLRDKISHNYRGIDPYIVWDIVQNSLPKYQQLLNKIAPKVDEFKETLEVALSSKYYKHLHYLKP